MLCSPIIIAIMVMEIHCDCPSPRGRTLEETRGDRDVEKLAMKASSEEFRAKTDSSLLLGREVGNMYTASAYGGIASILAM